VSSTPNTSLVNHIIVEVVWLDAEACGDSGWTNIEEGMEEAAKRPPLMRTLGYVLYSNEEFISVTDSIGPEECGMINKIPKQMIKELYRYDRPRELE
tara:strand:+ start:2911 stop:3201 length:291 start_codon:yes stop_codon:yes gene_type:complete